MIGNLVAEEYVHPMARTVADTETALAECAGTPLWSLSDKDIDDLVPRAYGLLARAMGGVGAAVGAGGR